MLKEPLVSVLMAAYNHEKYVQEAIYSIINQTYKNIELIIIDDGSTDKTWQRIQELKDICKKRFSRVYFNTQKNIGSTLTANKLSALAQGEYSYSIASDDVSKPTAIEKLVQFLSAHPDYVLAVGDNEMIDDSSARIGWDEKRNSVPVGIAKYKTFGEYLQRNSKNLFLSDKFGSYEVLAKRNHIPNGYLIRLNVLHKIEKYTQEAPLDDWFLHLQLSKLGKYKYIDEVLFSYRWHDSNTIKQKEKMKYYSYKTIKYEEKLVNKPGFEKYKKIFNEVNYTTKMKINIINSIKYYNENTLEYSRNILEIFGKKIVFKFRSKI